MRSFIVQLFFVVYPFVTSAQWTRIHPTSPIQRYLAHAFVSGSGKWISIGNDIASSNDKGLTWNVTTANTLPVYLKADQKYTDIVFQNDNIGFIAFEKSIYKTTDGGAHWQQVISLNANHSKYAHSAYFNAMTFIDQNNGWAVGEFRKIFRTTNGGNTWEEISWSSSTSPYIAYTDVHFINTSTGFIAGYEVSDILMNFGFEEFIMRTDDGGQTWKRQVLPTDADFRIVNVSFHDALTGYTCLKRSQTEDEVYVTFDGGENWIDRTPADLRKINALKMLADGRGFAFGETNLYRKGFFRTMDHGVTWTSVPLPIFDQQDEFVISDITFSDSNNGFAVGAGGNILTTNDGGATWNLSNAGYPALLSFDFVSEKTGYASSGKGFFKTDDGGEHWSYQQQSDSLTIYDLKFEDEARGAFFGWRNFYYSVKENATRVQHLSLPVTFISIGCFQQKGDSLFAAGTALSPRRNVLLRSGNGINWSVSDIPNTPGLIIQMERKGNFFYYSDGSSVLRSSRSGTNWTHLGSFTGDYVNGIIVLDDENILASFQSGKIKRFDGGEWTNVADFSPGSVTDFIANDELVFAYGNTIKDGVAFGAIWRSSDDGFHWQKENLPVIDFGIRDMDIEGDTAWATGGYGQIFALKLSTSITGNEYELHENKLAVYPVPAGNNLFIESISEKIIHVELLTATGVQVQATMEAVTPFQWKIDISNIARGLYIVRAETSAGWQWHRVIRE